MIDASQLPPQRLVAIIEIQNAIARSRFDLSSVMAVVVERAMELTAAHGAVVELADGDAMLYRAACGSVAQFVGLRIARSGSLAGLCIDQGVALHAPDTSVDDRVDRAACKRVGAAAMVCVPLFHGGHAVGVLKVVSSQPHAFDDATPVILSLLADARLATPASIRPTRRLRPGGAA